MKQFIQDTGLSQDDLPIMSSLKSLIFRALKDFFLLIFHVSFPCHLDFSALFLCKLHIVFFLKQEVVWAKKIFVKKLTKISHFFHIFTYILAYTKVCLCHKIYTHPTMCLKSGTFLLPQGASPLVFFTDR